MDTTSKVVAIVAYQANRDMPANDQWEVGADSNLIEDCGLDSIDHIELTLRLEDAFGISILDAEMERWRSVSDIIKLVGWKLHAQAADAAG